MSASDGWSDTHKRSRSAYESGHTTAQQPHRSQPTSTEEYLKMKMEGSLPGWSPSPGDWVCGNPKCKNVNWAKRLFCNICNVAKGATEILWGRDQVEDVVAADPVEEEPVEEVPPQPKTAEERLADWNNLIDGGEDSVDPTFPQQRKRGNECGVYRCIGLKVLLYHEFVGMDEWGFDDKQVSYMARLQLLLEIYFKSTFDLPSSFAAQLKKYLDIRPWKGDEIPVLQCPKEPLPPKGQCWTHEDDGPDYPEYDACARVLNETLTGPKDEDWLEFPQGVKLTRKCLITRLLDPKGRLNDDIMCAYDDVSWACYPGDEKKWNDVLRFDGHFYELLTRVPTAGATKPAASEGDSETVVKKDNSGYFFTKVKRWNRKKGCVMDFKRLVFTINLDEHWFFVVFNADNGQLTAYDSLRAADGQKYIPIYKTLRRYLKEEAKQKYDEGLVRPWPFPEAGGSTVTPCSPTPATPATSAPDGVPPGAGGSPSDSSGAITSAPTSSPSQESHRPSSATAENSVTNSDDNVPPPPPPSPPPPPPPPLP